jgi:hypothetical protein
VFSARESCYRTVWGVLAEELLVSQRSVVELIVIVLGAIKELSVSRIQLVIVLRGLDIEVGNPTQLAINVSLLRQLGVVWHSSALNFVFLIGIELSLRVKHHSLLILKVVVEILLKEKSMFRREINETYLVIGCVRLVEM